MPENIIQIDQNLLETRLDRLITETNTSLVLNKALDEGKTVLFEGGQATVMGIQVLDTGVFGGIILGCITGAVWGYDIPYLLTGRLNQHPSAAIDFCKEIGRAHV